MFPQHKVLPGLKVTRDQNSLRNYGTPLASSPDPSPDRRGAPDNRGPLATDDSNSRGFLHQRCSVVTSRHVDVKLSRIPTRSAFFHD